MNARIQRLQLLLRLLLAGGALLWLWPRQPLLAVAVALLVGWFYGLIMALGFSALLRVNRGQSAPRPAVGVLLRAWARELWVSERVFGWQQPFAEHCEPDHLPPAGEGRRGVLLLHGYTCNRGLWNGWMRRLRQRGHAFVALSLEPAFGSIDAYVEAIEAAVQRLERSTGLAPVVVAHSMGGLALRAWWRRHGDAEARRIRRAFTLGSPHAGTLMARFATALNARQMRRHSDWLAALAAQESAAFRARLVCYYSHADQIVCPADTAVLVGSEARHAAGQGHLTLVFDESIFAAVLAELEAP